MAYDKVVDSTALDSDLASVANAIRAKSGGSGQLAFPAGFVNELNGIRNLVIETQTYTPAADAISFEVNDPRPTDTPKLVTVELDPKSWTGEMSGINVWSLFAPMMESGVLYSGYYRYLSLFRYYNSAGSATYSANTGGSGYAPGFSSPRGTIMMPGRNAAGMRYRAGATYKIKLYYWEDET